jgi:hypothetical protein
MAAITGPTTVDPKEKLAWVVPLNTPLLAVPIAQSVWSPVLRGLMDSFPLTLVKAMR